MGLRGVRCVYMHVNVRREFSDDDDERLYNAAGRRCCLDRWLDKHIYSERPLWTHFWAFFYS